MNRNNVRVCTQKLHQSVVVCRAMVPLALCNIFLLRANIAFIRHGHMHKLLVHCLMVQGAQCRQHHLPLAAFQHWLKRLRNVLKLFIFLRHPFILQFFQKVAVFQPKSKVIVYGHNRHLYDFTKPFKLVVHWRFQQLPQQGGIADLCLVASRSVDMYLVPAVFCLAQLLAHGANQIAQAIRTKQMLIAVIQLIYHLHFYRIKLAVRPALFKKAFQNAPGLLPLCCFRNKQNKLFQLLPFQRAVHQRHHRIDLCTTHTGFGVLADQPCRNMAVLILVQLLFQAFISLSLQIAQQGSPHRTKHHNIAHHSTLSRQEKSDALYNNAAGTILQYQEEPHMRIYLEGDPYLPAQTEKTWSERGAWPCHWIGYTPEQATPAVIAFRLCFHLNSPVSALLHVTADQRYTLFLDGVQIGEGSERGDADHWYFESWQVDMDAGPHILVARVWWLADMAPYAQMSLRPGFLLSPQSPDLQPLIGTGLAHWEAALLQGCQFKGPQAAWGTGANMIVHGEQYSWGHEKGEGENWLPAVVVERAVCAAKNDRPPSHLLTPSSLPPMMRSRWNQGRVRHVQAAASLHTSQMPVLQSEHIAPEAELWQNLLSQNAPLHIPPHTARRILIDLQDYLCAYPVVQLSGGRGALVRVHWQEALFEQYPPRTKGSRDEVEGKYFTTIWSGEDGIGDTFLPDGGQNRVFSTLWWQCGRYVEVYVQTGEEPLAIENLCFLETRYPLEKQAAFSCSDPRLEEAAQPMVRALQMCSHETYMDCPYYEQLMYAGDTRLEIMATRAITSDDRLPLKALRTFGHSLHSMGLTRSRYPSRVAQTIPPFSLWWIGMLYDTMMWRECRPVLRELMPAARAVAEYYLQRQNSDGLTGPAEGWNYMDWVEEWPSGEPPDGRSGCSGLIHWQFVHVLGLLAELEGALGEPEMALRCERLAAQLAQSGEAAFWNEEKSLFADDLQHTRFSEHTQCMAILSHRLSPRRQKQVGDSLMSAKNLARATIYFQHYLFDALYMLGRTDKMLEHMELWFSLKSQGFKTTLEKPEPSRSDCHAWGAHPLHHYTASLLGIRPASPGFHTVRIAPQPAGLAWLRGEVFHPAGKILVELQRDNGMLTGMAVLPQNISGSFEYADSHLSLLPGENKISMRDH